MTVGRARLAAGAASAALLLCAAATPAPEVHARHGDVWLDGGGQAQRLTVLGDVVAVSLSPERRRIALVRLDKAPKVETPTGEGDPTSLWIMPARGGAPLRRLTRPRGAVGDCPAACRRMLADLETPVWSLDGGFVYVLGAGWVTSGGVHQVDVRTGSERFVIDGNSLRVIRTGPYRGMLLVGRHKYRGPPELGSYDPVDVVRPDGEVVLTVPGSDKDEGDASVAKWLKANGWTAR